MRAHQRLKIEASAAGNALTSASLRVSKLEYLLKKQEKHGSCGLNQIILKEDLAHLFS